MVADFSGGRLSSDGGVLLLRQLDSSLGLTRSVANCLQDRRNPIFIEHTLPELLAQRILSMALGYEDLNDQDSLRHDPLLAAAAGKTNPEQALASAPTLNRIKEQQGDLFGERLSSQGLAANQLRLWLSAFAYVLMERLRTATLKGTELAQATAGTIRLRLLKLAARVEVSTRRLRVRLAESAPVQALFAHAWRRLRPAPS